MEKVHNFVYLLYSIWDVVKDGMAKYLEKYLDEGHYKVDDQRPSDLKTPLHIAVQRNNKEIVKILLHKGADPYIQDKDSKVPIDYCLTRGEKAK